MLGGEARAELAQKWARALLSLGDEAPLLRITAEWGALLGTAMVAGGLLLGVPLYTELEPSLGENSRVWLVWLLLLPAATLALALLPGSIVGLVVSRNRHTRGALALPLVLWWLGSLYFLGDMALYQRFGRHWGDILVYATLPEAQAAAGDGSSNLQLGIMVACWATLLLAGHLILRKVASISLRRFRPALLAGAHLATLMALLALIGSLWFMPRLLPDGFGPRLVASLSIRPGGPMSQARIPQDPALAQLQRELEQEYKRLFPFAFRTFAEPSSEPTRARTPPNVALIVAESMRWEMLNAADMPRLHAWSQRGLLGTHHYAGTNHSESGLFVLFYGESPLRFNTTLDHKIPPTLCQLLRPSGYRCGYYTGHPKEWLRREEFLNPQTMDDFVHDNRGTWNEWDRRALASAARNLRRDGRTLTLTFLMSSHYEYKYPQAYRKHTPDDPPSTSWLPGRAKRSEFASSRNRYRNVAAFLDDLIMDHIETLDESTLVVFTGDHGESTGEDGRFGHGYGFSDLLTRVPLVVVGPGISPQERTEMSSHRDILPTILHAIGLPVRPQGPGVALQSKPAPRPLLQTYTRIGRPIADALLLVGNLRLSLTLDPVKPEVEIHGLVDAFDRPIPRSPTPDERQQLRRAFVIELEKAGTAPY